MSTVTFTFDGKQYTGQKGESLASALLRNGVLHFTDSSYKDRPRGVMGLWVEEPNALVNIDSGAGEPMVMSTTIEIVEGLVARSSQGVGDLPDTRQRMPASTNWSISPSSTAEVLPVSISVLMSLTIW